MLQRKSLSSFHPSCTTSLFFYFHCQCLVFFYFGPLAIAPPATSFLSPVFSFFPSSSSHLFLLSFPHLHVSLLRACLCVCVLAVWARCCQNLPHTRVRAYLNKRVSVPSLFYVREHFHVSLGCVCLLMVICVSCACSSILVIFVLVHFNCVNMHLFFF